MTARFGAVRAIRAMSSGSLVRIRSPGLASKTKALGCDRAGGGWPIRSCARAARRPSLRHGLRLPEHVASAFQVVGGNYDLQAPCRGVGKIDVHISVGELPGHLAERHAPVLDPARQDFTLVSDPYSGALKRRPASGHGLVVQEHVHNTPALTGEGREATEADTALPSHLPPPPYLTRPPL